MKRSTCADDDEADDGDDYGDSDDADDDHDDDLMVMMVMMVMIMAITTIKLLKPADARLWRRSSLMLQALTCPEGSDNHLPSIPWSFTETGLS